MALNKIYSVYVIAGAAVLAIVMSFVGKVSALLQSIPSPVLGGISIALFGVIASSGLKILIEAQTNFDNKKEPLDCQCHLGIWYRWSDLAAVGSANLRSCLVNYSGNCPLSCPA